MRMRLVFYGWIAAGGLAHAGVCVRACVRVCVCVRRANGVGYVAASRLDIPHPKVLTYLTYLTYAFLAAGGIWEAL